LQCEGNGYQFPDRNCKHVGATRPSGRAALLLLAGSWRSTLLAPWPVFRSRGRADRAPGSGRCRSFFTSEPGKQLIGFGKDSYKEVRKVVWPTRKEALQNTAMVFAFVPHGAVPVDHRQDARVRAVRPRILGGSGKRISLMTKHRIEEGSAEPPTRWYVVHAYSGMEKSVQRALQERIERAGMQDKFGRILVPTEEVVEVKNGQKSVTERRFFPGYVLVEMEMTTKPGTWSKTRQGHRVSSAARAIARARSPESRSR
jgi:hypothetical protein